LVNAFDLKW